MKCRFCEIDTPDDSNFCKSCGRSFFGRAAWKNMLIALVIVIGVGGLVTISFVQLSPRYTSFVVAAGAAFVCMYIWLEAKKRERLARFGLTELKDTSSYLQSCFTIAALILGAGWVVHTWNTQWDDQRAGLQINIFAEQKHPPETTDGDGLFIGGNIVFKNAGTRRTTIRLADGPLFIAKVVPRDSGDPRSMPIPSGTSIEHKKLNRFKELMEHNTHNKLRDSEGMEFKKLEGEISTACKDGKMGFDQNKVYRFWLSRPPIDGRPDIELQDEIRPGEEDEFHFLVKVAGEGTYAVIFSSELTQEEEKLALPLEESVCGQNGGQPRWESAAYFVEVKKSVENIPQCCSLPASKNSHQQPRSH